MAKNPDLLHRPWALVADRVARARDARFREHGDAAFARALAVTTDELRAGRSYRDARAEDLAHHLRLRKLLDRVAGRSAS